MAGCDFGVVIARLQPLHIGCETLIRAAFAKAERIIILVDYADVARETRNPFTFLERRAMLESVFAQEIAQERLIVAPLRDHRYDDAAWRREGEQTIAAIAARFFAQTGKTPKIGLIVCEGGAPDRARKIFSQWRHLVIPAPGAPIANAAIASALVRENYFQRSPALAKTVSPGVASILDQLTGPPFETLAEEARYLQNYPKQWGLGPFVTADAIVLHAGRVLLIERGRIPGKGLLAAPGGFVDLDEPIRDAAIRELIEETAIHDESGPMRPQALSAFIADDCTRVFDAPHRSSRGRVITHAFLFRLPDARAFFITGADDAARADWFLLDDLKPEQFFEDHWAILQAMTKF